MQKILYTMTENWYNLLYTNKLDDVKDVLLTPPSYMQDLQDPSN